MFTYENFNICKIRRFFAKTLHRNWNLFGIIKRRELYGHRLCTCFATNSIATASKTKTKKTRKCIAKWHRKNKTSCIRVRYSTIHKYKNVYRWNTCYQMQLEQLAESFHVKSRMHTFYPELSPTDWTRMDASANVTSLKEKTLFALWHFVQERKTLLFGASLLGHLVWCKLAILEKAMQRQIKEMSFPRKEDLQSESQSHLLQMLYWGQLYRSLHWTEWDTGRLRKQFAFFCSFKE